MQPAAVLNVAVNAHTAKAATELRKFDRTVKNTGDHSRRATANVDRMTPAFNHMAGSAGNASRAMKKLAPGISFATRIPAYKFAAIGSAIQAIVPPVVALTSALAPLTGLLGALPGLASAAAQGIGTIALGMSGIGDAVKAAMDSQKTAAKDASSSLQAHRAAAEGVRTAIRGVGDAERGLADAQRQSKDAQKDLSAARRDAARELVDLRLAVSGAALSEKEARLELTEAVQAQADVWADQTSTAMDARDAELAVQRARLGLKESTVESKRAQVDYNDAQKKGIKGSDQVVSAQRGIQDAQRGVTEAQRALIDATRQVRIAQRDQAESAGQAAGGVEKLQTAMEGLPPAGRNFARFIVSLKPRLDELRAAAASGIFPPLTRGIKAAMGNFGAIRGAIASTATALGELGERAGRKLGSAEWGRDLQVQGERNVETITRLGNATLSLADGFRHIMLAAGPLVSFLTSSAERFSAIFAAWAEGARESGKLDAFFRKTITTTKLVVEAFWDFGRALVNVGKIADRVWGQDLLRGINNVAERFRAWTESVRGQRAIEGYFERWRRRWTDIAEAVGKVIGQYSRLRKEGKSAADAFTHVFADSLARLIPAVANHLGEQMPQIVSGFVRGFLNADAWGKLLVGTWLIAKFGGLAAFVAIGRRLGAALGLGIGSGAAAAAAGGAAGGGAAAAGGGILGAMRSKLLPLAKKAGLAGVGIALADSLLSEFSRRSAEKSTNIFEAIKAKQGGLFAGDKLSLGGTFRKDSEDAARSLLPVLKDIAEKAKAISPARAKELRQELKRLGDVAPQAKAQFNNLIDAAVHKGRQLGLIRQEFHRMKSGSIVSLEQLRKSSDSTFRRISNTMGLNTREGREAAQKNFRLSLSALQELRDRGVITAKQFGREVARLMDKHTGIGKERLKTNMFAARTAIAEAMGGAVKITDKGAGAIRRIFAQELKLYGLSSKEIGFRLEGREFSGKSGKGLTNKQRGGPINVGAPSGDTVPAMLERGEYVLNRKAVAKAGRRNLDNLNFAGAPRFQEGGGVGAMVAAANRVDKAQFPYVWGGGHQASPAPLVPFDCSGAVSYVLQQGGVQIPTMVSGALAGAGQPGPGKVTVFANPTHTFMRLGNRFFGTSGSNPGGGAGWFPDPGAAYRSGFAQRHFAATGGGLGRVPKISVGGPDSALKDVVQGALSKTRNAANKRMQDLMSTSIGAGDAGDPGPFSGGADAKANRRLGKKLAARFGWTGAQWSALDKLWTGESGWINQMNQAGSGATGIPQALPGSKMASEGADWATNPATQIRWGLKYIKGRYGDPVNAYNTWLSRSPHWYAKGGMVGYAGDSLGVGTIGPLRGLLDRAVQGHPSSGKTSGWGVGQLVKGAAQHVFDFGTNDATGSAIRQSINRVNQRTGKKPVHVMTVNGTPAGGQSVELKNKAIRAAAHGDVRLVDWAAKHKGQLDSLGHGAYPERARLIAGSIRQATGAEKKAAKAEKVGKPFGGSLGKVLTKTLKTLRSSKSAKVRGTRLKQFEKRVRKLGLPKSLHAELKFLSESAEVLGTRATAAGSLNVENDDDTTTLGIVQGKTEGGWLNDQLAVLLAWRNKLLDAIKIVEKRRAQAMKLIERGRKRLAELGRQMKLAAKVRKQVKHDLDVAKKKPKQNKERIANLNKLLGRLDDEEKPRVRESKGLKETILPALKSQFNTLGGANGLQAFQESLVQVQGPGGPMTKFATAPALGTFAGGDIFDVQLRLKELATPATAAASDSPVTDDSQVEFYKQLLREANLRTAVSERQFNVLKNFDATSGGGFMGAFAKGGVALVGEKGPELAHLPSGTRVHTASETQSMLSPNVQVHINGDIVNTPRGKQPVEVVVDGRVERATRTMARNAGRRLPGRGGGG